MRSNIYVVCSIHVFVSGCASSNWMSLSDITSNCILGARWDIHYLVEQVDKLQAPRPRAKLAAGQTEE